MQPYVAEDLHLYRTLQGLRGSADHDTAVLFVVSRASKGDDSYMSTVWSFDSSAKMRPSS